MPDEPMPEEVAKKFDEILGQDTGGGGKRVVDEAYIQDEEEEEIQYDEEEQAKKDIESGEKEVEDEATIEEVEDKQEEPSEEVSEAAADEDKFEDIPDNLIKAGRDHGFSDEKIIDLAENSPEVLEALAGTYENYQELAAKVREAPQVKETKSGQEIETPLPPQKPLGELKVPELTDVEPEVAELVKTLVKDRNQMAGELNTFRKEMGTFSEQAKAVQQQRVNDYSSRVDGFFDNSKISQFGNTKSLTPAHRQARTEAHNIAAALQGDGVDVTEANLEKALKAYKGLYGIQEATKASETAVSKKLQKRKKKFTARPGGQKTATKYKTDQDRVLAAMDKAAQDGGYELSG